MKKFEFPLNSALEYRRLRSEAEQAVLSKIAGELRALQGALSDLEQQKAEAEASIGQSGPVDPAMLAALDGFRQHVQRRKQDVGRQITECGRRLTAQNEKVQAARREWRLLENLKDRRWAEWLKEVDKEAETLAGEMHLARRVRERVR